MDYLDFKISVEHRSDQEYRISVSSERGGEFHETTHFPFDSDTLKSKLTEIRRVLYTTGVRSIGRRRAEKTIVPKWKGPEVRAFGNDLFKFLFPRETLGQYRNILAKASDESTDTGVRIKLRFAESASALAQIPWEFLYDATRKDYVTLNQESALVRYLDLPIPVAPLTVSQPLRVLGMISNPLNDLDVSREKEKVAEALADLIDDGKVELGWTEGDRYKDLRAKMKEEEWHVFHYIGHGGFDDEDGEGEGEGFLLLGGEGEPERLYAKDLSRLIRKEKFQLVFLNACDGAASDSQDLFSSTASTLVTDGMPAILAMQYPISDKGAITLSHTFYESISEGLPVDYALAEARINIKRLQRKSLEWATPVLFMRSKDGRLFEVESATQKPAQAHQPANSTPSTKPVVTVVEPEKPTNSTPQANPVVTTIEPEKPANNTPQANPVVTTIEPEKPANNTPQANPVVTTIEPEKPANNTPQANPVVTTIEPEKPASTSTAVISIDRVQLSKFLDDSFNISELKDVCFEINIDPENLGYSGKKGLVRELVKFLQRRKKVPDLLNYLVGNSDYRELLESTFGPFGTINFSG